MSSDSMLTVTDDSSIDNNTADVSSPASLSLMVDSSRGEWTLGRYERDTSRCSSSEDTTCVSARSAEEVSMSILLR